MSYKTVCSKKPEPKVLVNVLLSEKQIKAFDNMWRINGYMNRSSCLRDIIMASLEKEENENLEAN